MNLFFYTNHKRSGFVLYIVCAIVIGLFILILGLNKFKSGATLQLSKNITQEKMIAVAQSASNESFAVVRSEINNEDSEIGGAVKSFWTNSKDISSKTKIWSGTFSGNKIKASTSLAKTYLGSDGGVSCNVNIYATECIIGDYVKSYLGYLEIISKVKCDGVKDAVSITEGHEIKITDLSYPFLDKYAFFVKNFCGNLNANDKKFVVNGITNHGELYSFIYLGNKNYPQNEEYTDPNSCRIILDINFEKDKKLLGSFPNGKDFELIDSELTEKAKGQFFKTEQTDFKNFSDDLDTHTDFQKNKELLHTWVSLVRQCQQSIQGEFGSPYLILNDYVNAQGKAENSEIFISLIESAIPVWKYYYGYTDFNHAFPEDGNIGTVHPFEGLVDYFTYIQDKNPVKLSGGSMPEFFGEERKVPVYIDGPVYARFFRIGFIDKFEYRTELSDFDLSYQFPTVACRWEKEPETFSGKKLTKKVDIFSRKMMSQPIEKLSINSFFYGPGENKDKDNTLGGGIKGEDVYHYLDPKLRTVSYFYKSIDDFVEDRIKIVDGKMVLVLDGISVISDNANLDLTKVSEYMGKGMIIHYAGNCLLGNLQPMNNSDYLKINLMNGNFITEGDANITASLIALSSQSHACTFISNGNNVVINGNLIIDDLYDMRDKKNFTINHDWKIYGETYPVRVSVGAPKTFYVLEYKGKD